MLVSIFENRKMNLRFACIVNIGLACLVTGCHSGSNREHENEGQNQSKTHRESTETPQGGRHLLPISERRLWFKWEDSEEEYEQRIQKALKLIQKFDGYTGEVDEGCLRFGEWQLIVFKPVDRNKGISDAQPEYINTRAYVVDLYRNIVIPQNGWEKAYPLYANLAVYYKDNKDNTEKIDQVFHSAFARITSAIAFKHDRFVSLDGELYHKPLFRLQDSRLIFDYDVAQNRELKRCRLFISEKDVKFEVVDWISL